MKLTTTLVLLVYLFCAFHSHTFAADKDEGKEVQAKDIDVLPIAPQTEDGFKGELQTSFAPPKIKNFSAEMLKQAIQQKSVKKKGPVANSKRPSKKTRQRKSNPKKKGKSK